MMGSVYLFCLVLGFTFTVAGALLGGLLGGHHGDAGGGGDVGGHDIGGHDVDPGSDVGAGHHVEAGGYDANPATADAGHGDGDVAQPGAPMHLPILSPTVLSFFIATFGGAGLIYRQVFGDNPLLHVPLAAGTAVAMGLGMAYMLWKVTSTLDSRSVARESDVLGQLAEVVVTIPKEGTGEVAYVSAKTRQTLTARSADGKEYKQGAQVKVLKVGDGIAWVSEPAGVGVAAVGSVSGEHPAVGEPVRDREREH